MRKQTAWRLAAGLSILILLVSVVNLYLLQRTWLNVRHADSRLKAVDVVVHFDLFVLPTTVFFDVRGMPAGASPELALRAVAAFAASQPLWSFADLKLAHMGAPRYRLSGKLVGDMAQAYRTHYLVGVKNVLQAQLPCSSELFSLPDSCKRDVQSGPADEQWGAFGHQWLE